MKSIKRYLIWLRRMSHSRGFGVQSPSAYRFIRYVVSEHYPYYAYDDLRTKYPTLDWLTRKRMELYFRLANFRRAEMLVDYSTDSKLLADYVARGCNRTTTINALQNIADNVPMGFVRISATDGCEVFLKKALAKSEPSSVFIVEDICTNDAAHRMWQTLLGSEKVSVSYDLYYCGIAFFDTDRYKTNYIVNF